MHCTDCCVGSLLPLCTGLSITSRGFTVMQYSPLTSSIVVYEGLTLDAAWGYCSMDRSTTPVVYMHRPHDATSQQVKPASCSHCMLMPSSTLALGHEPDTMMQACVTGCELLLYLCASCAALLPHCQRTFPA